MYEKLIIHKCDEQSLVSNYKAVLRYLCSAFSYFIQYS